MPHPLDLATRKFWRLTGRPVDLDGAEAWLRAPVSRVSTVADGWLREEAARHGGAVDESSPGAGLLPDVGMLDGPGFDSSQLRAEIRDFYENTANWSMEVWAGWSPVFWPAGELISRWFGRRVEQLALPMRPLDVAHGMDSRVDLIRDAEGTQIAAAWLRMLRTSGRFVFSGCYSARTLPGAERPSVHVAFPLESGNVQVFLRPKIVDGGGLLLRSLPSAFAEDGTYVVVHDHRHDFAARVPLHETFHVYVDRRGVLRTDHELRIWNASVVRLHYKLEAVA